MKTFAVLILAFLSVVSARAAVAESQNYDLTTIGLDSGGGRSVSSNYTGDVSFGLTVGRSSAPSIYANTLGFVAQFNNPPIGVDDIRSHVFEQFVDIVIPGLVVNDFDPDSIEEIISLHSFEIVTEAGGTVSMVASALRYFPPPNFKGIDYFDYTLIDQDGDTDVAQVTVVSIPAITQAPNTLTMIRLSDGNFLVRMQGPANANQFQIYTTTNVAAAQWDLYSILENRGDGVLEFIIDPKETSRRFFRVLTL